MRARTAANRYGPQLFEGRNRPEGRLCRRITGQLSAC